MTGGIGIGLPDDGDPYASARRVSVGRRPVSTCPPTPSASRTVEASTTVGGIDVSPQLEGPPSWDVQVETARP